MRYSRLYADDVYEYMHVILHPRHGRCMPRDRALTPPEWREWKVAADDSWEHYLVHGPEPHILLLRRRKRALGG